MILMIESEVSEKKNIPEIRLQKLTVIQEYTKFRVDQVWNVATSLLQMCRNGTKNCKTALLRMEMLRDLTDGIFGWK